MRERERENFWPENRVHTNSSWPRKRPTAAVTVRVQRTLPLIGGVAGRGSGEHEGLRGGARQGKGAQCGCPKGTAVAGANHWLVAVAVLSRWGRDHVYPGGVRA